jgi:hypothetical protein
MGRYEYYNCLNPVELRKEDDYRIPGYRRGSWATRDVYGYCVKNVNTETRFRFVLHSDGKETLVELFQFIDYNTPSIPVPMSILKRFLKDTTYEKFLVERDGHAFISGIAYNFRANMHLKGDRPSYDMCMSTNARDIIKNHGDLLATMLKFPDKIRTMDEADKVDVDLRLIGDFVHEMESPLAPNKLNRKRCEESISKLRDSIAYVDKEMNEYHERYRRVVQLLNQYKVTLERKL